MKYSLRTGISLVTAGLLAATLLPAQVTAQDTITWRVQSHWPSASSSYSDSLETLKELLAERTDGRLQLELHEAGSLFGSGEIFGAVSRGVLDMGTISPAYEMDRLSTAGVVYGLPNAFKNVWEAAYFYKQMGIEEMIQEEAAEYDVYYAIEKVYPTEMVLKEPVESMDDFESLNIRSSGILQTFLTEAGAAASMIPGEELYQSLQTGVVGGAHWGAVQGALSMSLYEVAPYHVRPPLNIGGIDAYVISEESLNELPEEMQETVKNTIEEQFWRRTNEYIYLEQRALEIARAEHGVEVIQLPEEVRARMLEAAQSMWDEEAAKSDRAAEAVEKMREFLAELGYVEQ
ncbi:TRAP transporter substrate-binding protein DctP [Aquisalimonas lutea]|uniref:TRAP transporter substrate-binding protein DctP n=1 Tax=Aquisalimonas lutea TaxID=1327750 RepID=UPI0025B4F827|nr:TRAP transporter substrate-binding protein DctP [Aquisalimonas lutea]MDN3517715.1 TRAP transporter substrate-binding protein DctP [Aquisalimonas lutea]